jgi:hypothetical protein
VLAKTSDVEATAGEEESEADVEQFQRSCAYVFYLWLFGSYLLSTMAIGSIRFAKGEPPRHARGTDA